MGSRLYVGNLSDRLRTRDIDDVFRRYGRIRDIENKGSYCFVEYSDPRDAYDAMRDLHGYRMDGYRLIVERAKERRDRDRDSDRREPGSGKCFNCGGSGHWARDCKEGDWTNKCYNCKEVGHLRRDCSKESSGDNDNRGQDSPTGRRQGTDRRRDDDSPDSPRDSPRRQDHHREEISPEREDSHPAREVDIKTEHSQDED